MQKNKFTTYLLYAIGEIILVVIGILIAVYINSQYTASQNEKKIEAILRQMQQELLVDIAEARELSAFNIGRDSIARKIFQEKVDASNWKTSSRVTGNFTTFKNNRGAYERFMQNLEIVPDKYQTLLPLMTDMFVKIQQDIDDDIERLKQTSSTFDQIDHDPRAADILMQNTTEEEARDFFLNDPFVKNKTYRYMRDIRLLSYHANSYRYHGIELYHAIDSILDRSAVPTNGLLQTNPAAEDVASYQGTYFVQYARWDLPDITLKLDENGALTAELSLPDANGIALLWDQGMYFHADAIPGFFELTTNHKGQRLVHSSTGSVWVYWVHQEDIERE